jgi:hypothetical protein
LPMSAIKLFFKNWGNFTVEINTLISVSYQYRPDVEQSENCNCLI